MDELLQLLQKNGWDLEPDFVRDTLRLMCRFGFADKNSFDNGAVYIKGAGFGFPGIFSTREQMIIQSPNYPDIENIKIGPELARILGVPLIIDNDANMAAYGEYCFGAGMGAHSLVLLTIGTGVGTGIVLEGNLWQGACGFGGELGHYCVNPGGDKCKCGSRGCLETSSR